MLHRYKSDRFDRPRSRRERSAGPLVALKLRLTLIVLGVSPKDLCRRFATVNPSTAFTLQNAYKWLSGKSAPRTSQVYSEWAAILGEEFTGSFIAAASFDEFAAAVSARYKIPSTTLLELTGVPSPNGTKTPAPPLNERQWSINHLLKGSYLALSLAWSQAQAGRFIAGQVHITRDGPGLGLTYAESLFGRDVVMDGPLVCDGRTAQSMAVCRESGRCYLFALCVPAPPANLIGGIFSGSALHDFGARSCASRILFIRDHTGNNRSEGSLPTYLEPSSDRIGEVLGILGYGPDEAQFEMADQFRAFLLADDSAGLLEATPDRVGGLALSLDRLRAV